jgi:hypothetical protein
MEPETPYVNELINDLNLNPQISSFAKPKPSFEIKDSDGTVHSFAVEIKSSHNGPIPDTQLMSRILQAIEGKGTSEFSNVNEFASEDSPKFEVVSFKYERREDKKSK